VNRAAIAALAAALACSRPETAPAPSSASAVPASSTPAASGPPAAGAPEASPSAAVSAAVTPPPAPAKPSMPAASAPLDLPITSASAIAAGGDQPLARDAPTTIESASRFRVEVAVPLQDGRLALLDAAGAMVASAGHEEIGASWARYTIAPTAPLVPGSAYALRLDGAVDRSPRDAEGRVYAPAVWPLKTSGERPKPEPKKQEKRKRR
jgi:hypothetical protein